MLGCLVMPYGVSTRMFFQRTAHLQANWELLSFILKSGGLFIPHFLVEVQGGLGAFVRKCGRPDMGWVVSAPQHLDTAPTRRLPCLWIACN